MEYTDEFYEKVGRIVVEALENSGADMSQIYADKEQQKPDSQIFKNISGQYAEVKTKTKRRRK